MLVRTLALAALVVALCTPAALAADGAPPPASPAGAHGNPAAAGPRHGGGGLPQRLAELRQRLRQAGGAFERRCASGQTDTAACTAAAQKLLATLQRIDGRIGDALGKIQQRCGGGPGQSSGPAPAGQAPAGQAPAGQGPTGQTLARQAPGGRAVPRLCAHAEQVVRILQNVQAKIRQFEQKLQDWLAQPSASRSTADGSSSSNGAGPLPGLDQLGADLAAARNEAGRSGL